MPNVDTLVSNLSGIGDAIRAKTGKSAQLALSEMPDEIAGITGAPFEPGRYAYDTMQSAWSLEASGRIEGTAAQAADTLCNFIRNHNLALFNAYKYAAIGYKHSFSWNGSGLYPGAEDDPLSVLHSVVIVKSKNSNQYHVLRSVNESAAASSMVRIYQPAPDPLGAIALVGGTSTDDNPTNYSDAYAYVRKPDDPFFALKNGVWVATASGVVKASAIA